MAVKRFEAGYVSSDAGLVGFLADVFELERLDPVELGFATLFRLQSGQVAVKVMVPVRPPKPVERADPFFAHGGLRYLTLYVDDLDGVTARAGDRGGRIVHGPSDLGGGARIVVLEDPDGNPIEVVETGGAGG